MLLPNRTLPALSVPLLGGGTWTLADQTPGTFTIVVFYRGKHCPICKTYLKEIEGHLDQAEAQGIEIVAISMDSEDRAAATVEETSANRLKIGYNLPEHAARDWELYISSARADTQEPTLFSEPGLFVVRPDGTLFFAQVQSAPFTRPDFAKLLSGLKFVVENNYPARGDMTRAA